MRKGIDTFIAQSVLIHEKNALSTNNVGFMPKTFILTMLPHSICKNKIWKKTNGDLTLIIRGDNIPYGIKARLLLSFVASEVIKNKKNTIIVRGLFYKFLQSLSLSDSQSTLSMFRKQLNALIDSSIEIQRTDNEKTNINLLSWVEDKKILQVSDLFYSEIINHSFPIDLRAIALLTASSLAFDIYCWLTYRMSYLKKKTQISWQSLEMQFGSNYRDLRLFRFKFKQQLRKVLVIYNADVQLLELGIVLRPTHPHVSKIATV